MSRWGDPDLFERIHQGKVRVFVGEDVLEVESVKFKPDPAFMTGEIGDFAGIPVTLAAISGVIMIDVEENERRLLELAEYVALGSPVLVPVVPETTGLV